MTGIYDIITCLNRIKKIDAHRNGTITAEKYIKLQEFWYIYQPPENSSSREIFISSFRHFESKFRWNFVKVPKMAVKMKKKILQETPIFSHVKQIVFNPTFLWNERSNISLILCVIRIWPASLTATFFKISWNNILRVIWAFAMFSCCKSVNFVANHYLCCFFGIIINFKIIYFDLEQPWATCGPRAACGPLSSLMRPF
jgi:hypothetical protein